MTESPLAVQPPSADPDRARGRPVVAIAGDVLAVAVFVLVGRGSHGEGEALRGVVVTGWPFVAGLAVGWAILLARRIRPLSSSAGLGLAACTVAIGMVLRHTVSHDGTPLSFVVVASLFLTAFLVGWRALARVVRGRRVA
jgi:hypothetical protein